MIDNKLQRTIISSHFNGNASSASWWLRSKRDEGTEEYPYWLKRMNSGLVGTVSIDGKVVASVVNSEFVFVRNVIKGASFAFEV